MLTGLHILLTYKCTSECDHCFLHCAPQREGTFTLEQLRALMRQAQELGTVREIYFEGGEPFLYYPVMLEGVHLARDAGFRVGIVSNAYWATSLADALHWLSPLAERGISDLSVSDDDFHRTSEHDCRGEYACMAGRVLGIPASTICIGKPGKVVSIRSEERGKPVTGGGVLFKGRAAEKLTEGLPLHPLNRFTLCSHEDLESPQRVHVDAYGNVHLCQGLIMGNFWQTPLAELVPLYDGGRHPIAGPLLRGGPQRLFQEYKLPAGAGFVDECHACYTARKALLPRFPQYLTPREVYGQ